MLPEEAQEHGRFGLIEIELMELLDAMGLPYVKADAEVN